MSMKHLVEWELAGETEVLGGTQPQYQFVHHKPPHDLNWDGTQAAKVESRWLTPLAMAPPK
jgi:hypothetical protein